MKYSIVIPTLNCAEELLRLLESIHFFSIDKLAEIIIIDAESTDGTISVAHQFDTTIIKKEGISKGAGRTLGTKYAQGDVIINIDSDVMITETWFDAIKESIQHHDIVAGYSPHPKRGDIPRVPIYINGQDITWPFCNIAHKKEVFTKIGDILDTEYSEDIDFNYRCVKAGYTIHYNPKMKVMHYHTMNNSSFIKQSFMYGKCRAIINKRYPELSHQHQHGASLKNMIRLGIGGAGFFYEKLVGAHK